MPRSAGEMMNVGDMAPEFELMNQNKTKVKLSDYRGKKKVLLLFYPLDFSPVCTAEHCSFAPSMDQITGDGNDIVVFGVSCDSPFCHEAYRNQFNIPYDLLSDTSRKMVKAYDMFAGEEPFNCSARGTVAIGKDGKITSYKKVAMGAERSIAEISSAAAEEAAEEALEQRATEFGEGTASR